MSTESNNRTAIAKIISEGVYYDHQTNSVLIHGAIDGIIEHFNQQKEELEMWKKHHELASGGAQECKETIKVLVEALEFCNDKAYSLVNTEGAFKRSDCLKDAQKLKERIDYALEKTKHHNQ